MAYHYGQTIRRYRQQRGMSQSELAERWPKVDGTTGVSTRYIQSVEYGKKHITHPATLHALAVILDIPLWEFGLAEYDPFHLTPSPGLKESDVSGETGHHSAREAQILSASSPIPSAYYERMLRAYTQLEPALFSWTIWNLGLVQLSSQLNSEQRPDLHLTVMKCSPPSPRVRTIYEIAHYHPSLPRPVNLRFSGRESFAGRAIQEGKTLLDAQRCAVPITRHQNVSACLVVQLQTEICPFDVEIIQRYADLFSLAFSVHDFYPARAIDLYTIPASVKQEVLLQEFDLQRLDLISLPMTNPERIQWAERLIVQHVLMNKRGGIDVSVS